MHLTPTNLCITIAAARERPTWAAIMASIGASEGLAFHWLRLSKKDCDARLQHESKFYVTFEGDGADYWHLHLIRAKAAFMSGFERKVLDRCANDVTEICYDPSTGRPLQALNPEYLHRSQEWFEANGLDYDFDRFQWERDPLDDSIIRPLRPIWQTKIVQASAQLKIRALAAMLPKSWSERTQTDHVVSGQVVHTVAPPRFVPRAVREQQGGDVVDAQWNEVAPEGLPAPEAQSRPDIVALRAEAQRILNNPDRVTKPDPLHPPRAGDGREIGRPDPLQDFKPDGEDGNRRTPQPAMTMAADTPHPKETRQAQAPQEPPPPYARRTSTDAARTSPQGGNLNRSIRK